MRLIALTQGQHAKVDDEDFSRLNRFKWAARWDKTTKSFYAGRTVRIRRGRGGQRVMQMHREILAAPAGIQVDHRNRDTLDNQKDNLRFADVSQNHANTPMRRTNTTGYKGVFRNGQGFIARIMHRRRMFNLGTHKSPLLAAQAYNLAARSLFGEFAWLNPIN